MPSTSGWEASIRRILAVAGLTFREAYRRKVFIAALVMSVGFLGLYGLGLHYAGRDIVASTTNPAEEILKRAVAAQMLNFGLVPASFIVGLTAVFASVGSISSDLDTGVAHGILARPIRRSEFVIGKYLGLATMLAVYDVLLVSALVGLAAWQIGSPIRNLPAAVAVFALEPLILAAVAVLGSSSLPTLANGVLCTAAYGVSYVGGAIEQIGGMIKNSTMVNLGIVSSLLLPVDAVHRKAVSLLMPSGLLGFDGGALGLGTPPLPSAWMMLYAVAYLATAVGVAGWVFGDRDL